MTQGAGGSGGEGTGAKHGGEVLRGPGDPSRLATAVTQPLCHGNPRAYCPPLPRSQGGTEASQSPAGTRKTGLTGSSFSGPWNPLATPPGSPGPDTSGL